MATKKILTDLHIDGKVGIGTTNPGNKLDINSGTANSALRVLSTDRYTGIKFEDATNNDTLFYDGQSDLMYLSNTNFRAVDILATGNVGIGTNTPTKDLEIGTSGVAETEFRMNSDIAGKYLNILSAGNYSNIKTVGSQNFILDSSGTSGYLTVVTNGSERMRIDSSGNVGIGITNPTAELHISQGGGATVKLGTSLNTSHIEAREDGTANALALSANGSTDQLVLINGGNVGIGTTTPSEKLEVDGNILATGTIIATQNGGDASIYINNSRPSIAFTDSNSYADTNDKYIVRGTSSDRLQFQWYDDSASTTTETFNITSTGNATFAGTVTGSNLSGTNTGDQDLSTYALLTDITGTNSGTNTGDQDLSGYLLNTTDTFTGNLNILGGNNNLKESFINIKRGSGAGEWLKFQTDSTTANDVSKFLIRRNSDNVDLLSITTSNGATSLNGALTASNLSGTNTGDQDLSTYALLTDITGTNSGTNTGDQDLSGYLLNTTDTLTGNLTVTGNIVADTNIYTSEDALKIQAGGTSGTYIEIDDANDTVEASGSMKATTFIKNGGTSSQFLKADGSIDSNTYVSGDEYRKYYQIDYTEHIALSDEATALTTGTSKVTFRSLGNIKASLFRLSCNTAPTGSVITVDINVDGVSILSTKLTIDAGEKTSRTAATAMQFATGLDAISDDAEITVDIDGVGSTIAGAGLKLIMYYNHSVLIP